MRRKPHKTIMILIPRIEKVLESNITPYEKMVLIKQHIKDWKEK